MEGELRAAVSRNISLTGAYTWQKPEQLNIPFLLGIPPSALGLTPAAGVTADASSATRAFSESRRRSELPDSRPSWSASSAHTRRRRDFGVTLGTTWVQKVQAGYVTPVMLPSYAVWRGSVFYSHKNYSVNLAANNFTNSSYFTSQYLFWDVFIKPSAMRTLSLTIYISVLIDADQRPRDRRGTDATP